MGAFGEEGGDGIHQRGIDRCHDTVGEGNEIADRSVLIRNMPFQRQIRRVDLQQEPRPHDGFVFDPQRLAQRGEIGAEGPSVRKRTLRPAF